MIGFRLLADLMTAPLGSKKLAAADAFSGVDGLGGAAQPQELATHDAMGPAAVGQAAVPVDVEIQELRAFGYQQYDREHRIFVLTEDGVRDWLAEYNNMKRRVHALEEEQKRRVPLELIGERAVNALRRNPSGAKEAFLRVEDMVSTWVAANDGVGQEVKTMMDEAYQQVTEREDERAEHRWLLEHGGRNVLLERGDYNDRSFTQERHY